MAVSAMVAVGETSSWYPDLVSRVKKLKVGQGMTEGADLGPVISPAAKKRIEDLITSAEKEGATVLLDGRGFKVDGYPDGNWVRYSPPSLSYPPIPISISILIPLTS